MQLTHKKRLSCFAPDPRDEEPEDSAPFCGGWELIEQGDKFHVIPLHDSLPHLSSEHCWCRPAQDIEDPILTHHAADGREQYESGERRVS